MKTSKRHDNAIKVLVNAFFNGTLAKGTCKACAVGNLVANGLNAKIIISDDNIHCNKSNDAWGDLFTTVQNKQSYDSKYENKSHVLDNINATNYSVSELMKIEFAFETNTEIVHINYYNKSKEEIMQDQYNGLVAVFKVLCEIEGVESESDIKLLEYQNVN